MIWDIIHSGIGKISSYLINVIPKQYREKPFTINTIVKWFLVGLFIRLLVMPFTFHGDLLSKYRTVNSLLDYGYLSFHSPNLIFEALTLSIASYITPIQEFLTYSYFEPISSWLPVIENIYIFRTIFLLKLPYLIIDILICVLILHIFRDEVENGLRTFKFWILNPIILFAVYIFGRFEVIPIFFVLLCIFLLKENHVYLAVFSLGMAIFSRYYALLFLPLILLFYCRSWMEGIKIVILSTVPLLVYNIITYILNGEMVSGYFFTSKFFEYLLGMNFPIWGIQTIFIFVTAYTFLILYIYYNNNKKNPIVDFTAYSLIILLLFYAISQFHPQYFAWFIPFLAIYYGYTHDNSLIELHCLQIICFVFFTFYWGEALATWMFASIHPTLLIWLPSPQELIENLYPVSTFLNVVRSAFTAVLLFMIVKIILIQRKVSHNGK